MKRESTKSFDTPRSNTRLTPKKSASETSALARATAPSTPLDVDDAQVDGAVGCVSVSITRNNLASRHDPNRSPENAVEALLSLRGTGARFLTFDLSNDPSSPVQLAAWIREFKRLYWEKLSKDGLAFKPLSFIVLADRFTYADKVPLLEAGAILFDRSLPGNAHCQTTEQLLQWLDRNRQTESQQQSLRPRPQPPADGISPEDLEALNSYPHGMTKERLRRILRQVDAQWTATEAAGQTDIRGRNGHR